MKILNTFFILLFISFSGYSQFELPKKTLKIAPVTNSSGQISPNSSKSITYPSIFDKKDKLLEGVSLINKKPEEEKSVMERESFENPSKIYTDRMNNKNDGQILEKFKSNGKDIPKKNLLKTYISNEYPNYTVGEVKSIADMLVLIEEGLYD
jgi:hypothetical protein